MPLSSRKLGRALRRRFRIAFCLGSAATGGKGAGDSVPENRYAAGDNVESGSAAVEFTFLSLLLMVPLVYFIITVGQLQGGSFAVVGAADQAAKVFVSRPDEASGRIAAEQAVVLALADYGHSAGDARMEAQCEPADCTAAGSAVTVTVYLNVPLPFVPYSDAFQLHASQLSASATQVVGRFR